jgi:hypothetical protein
MLSDVLAKPVNADLGDRRKEWCPALGTPDQVGAPAWKGLIAPGSRSNLIVNALRSATVKCTGLLSPAKGPGPGHKALQVTLQLVTRACKGASHCTRTRVRRLGDILVSCAAGSAQVLHWHWSAYRPYAAVQVHMHAATSSTNQREQQAFKTGNFAVSSRLHTSPGLLRSVTCRQCLLCLCMRSHHVPRGSATITIPVLPPLHS